MGKGSILKWVGVGAVVLFLGASVYVRTSPEHIIRYKPKSQEAFEVALRSIPGIQRTYTASFRRRDHKEGSEFLAKQVARNEPDRTALAIDCYKKLGYIDVPTLKVFLSSSDSTTAEMAFNYICLRDRFELFSFEMLDQYPREARRTARGLLQQDPDSYYQKLLHKMEKCLQAEKRSDAYYLGKRIETAILESSAVLRRKLLLKRLEEARDLEGYYEWIEEAHRTDPSIQPVRYGGLLKASSINKTGKMKWVFEFLNTFRPDSSKEAEARIGRSLLETSLNTLAGYPRWRIRLWQLGRGIDVDSFTNEELITAIVNENGEALKVLRARGQDARSELIRILKRGWVLSQEEIDHHVNRLWYQRDGELGWAHARIYLSDEKSRVGFAKKLNEYVAGGGKRWYSHKEFVQGYASQRYRMLFSALETPGSDKEAFCKQWKDLRADPFNLDLQLQIIATPFKEGLEHLKGASKEDQMAYILLSDQLYKIKYPDTPEQRLSRLGSPPEWMEAAKRSFWPVEVGRSKYSKTASKHIYASSMDEMLAVSVFVFLYDPAGKEKPKVDVDPICPKGGPGYIFRYTMTGPTDSWPRASVPQSIKEYWSAKK